MIRIGRWMLAIAARLIPRLERSEWLAEWSAELWHLRHSEEPPCGPLRFCLGAIRDAALIRVRRPVCLAGIFRNPVACLSVLTLLASAAFLIAMECVGVRAAIARQPAALHAFSLLLALVILPVAVGVSIPAQPVRGWLLFVAKLALVSATVFFGVYDLAPVIGAVQPHATLIGYVLGFRWVLNDQRRRCPECLRRCGSPVNIGHPSYVLLDWYGTEFMCPEGHGLLRLPHLSKTSFSPHRWLGLDASLRDFLS